MSYSPRFSYTDSIARDLMRIEGAAAVVEVLHLPVDVGLRLRQEARSRSTHHSTRIEGNRLQETAIPGAVVHPDTRRTPDELEVRNYWRALEWIELQLENLPVRIVEHTFKSLHAIILPPVQGRPPKASVYRTEEVGIVGRGRSDYVYKAPRPSDVPVLMGELGDWVESGARERLPGPIRAAILAYQFLTIHPYMDGNGRTARALATMELWRSGYGMRGFLSIEEYYTGDISRYYAMLQMGLPSDYYRGRNDPDLTPWIAYFCEGLAHEAGMVAERAVSLYQRTHPTREFPWERLSRLQQQLLSRSLGLAMDGRRPPTFKPGEVAAWFTVHGKTAAEWLQKWQSEGFVIPASGERRIRLWRLGEQWEQLILGVADSIDNKARDKEGS